MAHEAQIPPVLLDSHGDRPTTPPQVDPPLAGPIETDFPWDMPMDALANAISIIRGEMRHMEIGLQAIERAARLPVGGWTPPPVKENVTLAERIKKETESQARFEMAVVDDQGRLIVRALNNAPWACPTHHATTRGIKGGNYCPVPVCSEYEGKVFDRA